PAGGPQPPPDDITAIVSRVVLEGRRLRIACRLVGKALRSCQVEVLVRRGRQTIRRFVLTIPAGGKQTVRIGRPRRVVLNGVLLAQDGSRYRVRRTLRRTT
ncbi:MAG: hypothetical protein M3389_03025, partial [Actinomycetota bacterium]|nr:hypothetical protein [Actinomycetota bacterium]